MSLKASTTKAKVYLVSFLVGLFYCIPVLAWTTASQTDSSATSFSYNPWAETWIQIFKSKVTGTLNSVTVYLGQIPTGYSYGCSIGDYGSNTGGTSFQTIIPTSSSKTLYTFTANAHIQLNANSRYRFNCSVAGNTGVTSTIEYGNASDVYSDGYYCKSNDYGTTCLATSSIKDLYFSVDVTPNASLINFVNTPTSTCNFNNWRLEPYFSAADMATCNQTQTCSIGVAFNAGFLDTNNYIMDSNGGALVGALDHLLDFPYYQKNNFTFTSGTVYEARAYICKKNTSAACWLGVGTNSNIIAYSDNYEFIVNGLDTCTSTYLSQGEIPAPFINSSTVVQNLTEMANAQCDGFRDGSMLGGTVWGICKAMAALFVPSQDVLNKFTDLKTQVANKPPFGYINVFSTQLNNLSTATSTTGTLATVTSTSKMQLTSIANISVFSTIRTVFGWFLWFIFVMYMYNRFKHFSLHG